MGQFIDMTGWVMSEHGVPVQVHTKSMYLGRFDNYDDAVIARKQAEEKYFGEYSFDSSREVATYV